MIRNFYTVYKTSSVLSMSYTTGGAALAIAPAIDPNRRGGRVEKGQQVYNYDNQKYFTISLDEVNVLYRLIENHITGNPLTPSKISPTFEITNNEKGDITIIITHFDNDGNPTKLFITLQETGGIALTIWDKQSSVYIHLSHVELLTFIEYLKRTNDFFVFNIAMHKYETYKRIEQENRQRRQNGYNNGYNNGYQQGNTYRQQYPQQGYQTPPVNPYQQPETQPIGSPMNPVITQSTDAPPQQETQPANNQQVDIFGSLPKVEED